MIVQIIVIILIFFVFWIILTYNRLVLLRNRTKEAWSDIDIQLKRRYDLIPNLVETVKGYAAHEKEVFIKVTEARARAMGAKTMKEHSESENYLSETLKTLFAVAENYPQLRASENFLELQREIRDTEDKIQAARRFYNTTVLELNTKVESFPANSVAQIFGFAKIDFFEIEEIAREPVKVKF